MAQSSCYAFACPAKVGLHEPNIVDWWEYKTNIKPYRETAAYPAGRRVDVNIPLRTSGILGTAGVAYPDDSLSGSLIAPQSPLWIPTPFLLK